MVVADIVAAAVAKFSAAVCVLVVLESTARLVVPVAAVDPL